MTHILSNFWKIFTFQRRKDNKIKVPNLQWHEKTLRQEGFFSQFGQDKFVARALENMRNGVFFDIGAFDGIECSNTFFFEKEFGWSGVAVEPYPETFQKLKRNRTCILINACIADYTGKVKFFPLKGGFAMLSKIVKKYESNISINSKQTREVDEDYIICPCYTLNEIAEKYGIQTIDLLSIDTEGEDLSILRSIDFSRVNINMIVVEKSYRDREAEDLLTPAGFQLVAKAGCDEIYQRCRNTESCI